MLNHRPVIGLTGGIGSGKSTVGRMLIERGCVVSDSDRDGRAALRDETIRDTLVAWWGEAILDDAGEVDRRAVGRIVFVDPDERRRLEALTHPWIERRRLETFGAAGAEKTAFVIDAPLLIEAGLDRMCDAVIFVDCDAATRLERVTVSRGWDRVELLRREDCQLPLDVKQQRADYVLKNDGDLGRLEAQVETVLAEIVKSCRT
ncbi:MAG: dephospho-CoA kinase [Planctomycetes bacterium]|nr:dephospho-CoA kinase [Planctomycetota bacterium]